LLRPEGSHYALAYIRRARDGENSSVLVYGAIGSAAVQIIKSLGARVTAVFSSEPVELVTGLGADRVIDRTTTTDFTTDTQKYNFVFDAVGKSSFWQCRKLLKPHGVWSSTDLGPLSLNPLLVPATRLSRGRRVLFPFPAIDQTIVEHPKHLVASRRFVPLVDRRYPARRDHRGIQVRGNAAEGRQRPDQAPPALRSRRPWNSARLGIIAGIGVASGMIGDTT
jgi:NADPH:quinone reductase-like Zn-dependent oxidoreductase